jgi:glycerol-3-phosphate dehydrogenase
MTAWTLADGGHDVEVFERGSIMGETSSASTKLLHGGLRYLEQWRLGLVREALVEREWWLAAAPHLARRLEFILPVYEDSPRPKLKLRAGLALYDLFARGSPRHRWLDRNRVVRKTPQLETRSLLGGFIFHDGQMNDRALGVWAAERASAAGARFHEHTPVDSVSDAAQVFVSGEVLKFDFVVNAAGPWAAELLATSGLPSRYQLDLVRGSHLLLDGRLDCAVVMQVRHDRRICFALPYEGLTLLGTTEVRQGLSDPIKCTDSEAEYLLAVYNDYFMTRKTARDITASFAGLRPLVRSGDDATHTSRECAIEVNRRLVTIFGGKWTSARALARKVARTILERTGRLV